MEVNVTLTEEDIVIAIKAFLKRQGYDLLKISRWKWCQGKHAVIAAVEQEMKVEEDQGLPLDPFEDIAVNPLYPSDDHSRMPLLGNLDDEDDAPFASIYGRRLS